MRAGKIKGSFVIVPGCICFSSLDSQNDIGSCEVHTQLRHQRLSGRRHHPTGSALAQGRERDLEAQRSPGTRRAGLSREAALATGVGVATGPWGVLSGAGTVVLPDTGEGNTKGRARKHLLLGAFP